MDVIFASSRGSTVADKLIKAHLSPENFRIYFESSAKLEDLQHMAYDFLEHNPDPTNCHIYFVAGLCDITHRIVDYYKAGRYEEVIYIDSPQDTIHRMTRLIDSISQEILILGAKPCFSTIIPCSLRAWNIDTRLKQGKTTHTLHSHQYEDMQYMLNRVVIEINQHITQTNISNNMATPLLASTILTRRQGAPPP